MEGIDDGIRAVAFGFGGEGVDEEAGEQPASGRKKKQEPRVDRQRRDGGFFGTGKRHDIACRAAKKKLREMFLGEGEDPSTKTGDDANQSAESNQVAPGMSSQPGQGLGFACINHAGLSSPLELTTKMYPHRSLSGASVSSYCYNQNWDSERCAYWH